MSGATGRRNRALKVTCLRSVHVRDARQSSLAKPAGRVGDIARWRRPHHGVRGRDRGIERGLRQARGQRRLELIGVQQPREPVRHQGRRRDAQPGPRADAAAVPGQHVLVPARRLRDRLRPAVPGRHARDHHRYQRRPRMPLPPRLPRIGQETPPATPAGTPGPVPVPAGMWRMRPAGHDEDTGVVLSVLVCQGWHPNHHHGPRPYVKHIRTTGPCVARCPPAD